jgi:hypothetical protein
MDSSSQEQRRLINTYDQCCAAGGDRIVIYWYPASGMHGARWSVTRWKDGVDIKTDPDSAWYHYGHKTFSAYPVREKKESQLQAAIKWVCETYGPREFVRNRMGDYLEKEVNDKFPLPKQERKPKS